MAETPELGSTAALAGAVVALARGLEFLIGKLRGHAEAPPLQKLADRVTGLETRLAVVESRGPVNDHRFEEVIRRLERLDEKLDRSLAGKHRGEYHA